MAPGAETPAGPSWLRPFIRAAWVPVGRPRAELAAIVIIVPLLLAPALWNGFPIIFYDTGAYLLEGVGRVFLAERAPVYSLFLDYGGAATSLWLIAIIQAALAAFVMVETARACVPHLPLAGFIGIVCVLVIATGLPWYAGQIEPDCFAALVVLSLYLLAFHASSLGRWRGIAIAAVTVLAVAVHPSHLLLGAGLVIAMGAYRLIIRFFLPPAAARANMSRDAGRMTDEGPETTLPRSGPPHPNLLRPAACCALGLALIVAANHVLTGQVFVSRAGPAFVFARLLQDRIVMRLLDDTCPQSGYKLCAYKDVLPRTADQWLWGRASPFLEMGRFTGTSAESTRIIWDSLRRYPLLQLGWALRDAAVQFATFRTGDQIEAQEWILSKPLSHFIPTQMGAYLAARQQQGVIDFRPINALHVPFGWLSLLALAGTFAWALRGGHRREALLLGFVLVALLGNAAICGALSNPHDRYQSRLLWLAPFAVLLIAGDHAKHALRGWGESGT